MNTRQRLAALLGRRRHARAIARISTGQIEKFRDHAAANGLDASREHYEHILAYRARVIAARRRPA